MPPRPRITREMVGDAAFDVARMSGWQSINARTVAERLNCSTQPVMYHFRTIDDLKKAALIKADEYHTRYLLNCSGAADPLLQMGLNYIRFADEEPFLFRFLFQSGSLSQKSLPEMIDSEELTPLLSAVQGEAGLSAEQAKEAFLTLAMFVHGYASIIANNALEYDEALIAKHLERAFLGAISSFEEETT